MFNVCKMADLYQAVCDAQRALGMEPRTDSRLTRSFVEGTAEPEYSSPETVAHELVMTHHIYSSTLYGDIIEEVMRNVAGWMRRKYKLPWGDTWTIVRFYVPTMLKLHCMISTGQVFTNIPLTLQPRCTPSTPPG